MDDAFGVDPAAQPEALDDAFGIDPDPAGGDWTTPLACETPTRQKNRNKSPLALPRQGAFCHRAGRNVKKTTLPSLFCHNCPV
ncbi:MAG: hypothetical protein ACLVJH_13105 [Faecalibacterium prausnitzii]